MVLLKVTLLEGRPLEKKRELAKKLTEAAARHFGVPREDIRLIFYEVSREDWAVGGTLMRDQEAG
ncbi:tautomerase family protein [Thermus scotoductus]|uniref:4-oxalocrotonate tautomerase n=1 Tax=Thermus scotoductus TaxID=37636 RepID=A0A430VTY8_THESC|nr:4-oxalocrotonate tautomerase family protein [Thermus scotoductus]RTG97532.1 4-oxalocrotonate tautomerase [Thermus scotoductus]RTH05985.1 4-oxalocrotonate tautomerase [Thermus scotoductus]RTH16880.1 4-oxalocrotonate tautomerase [Thermus scotoductus]RTI02054.1 4-oxalocrotonate tautomerase [Thermus scotoductus]RTI24383.1 4-oxalocrotonate tautomerase [Thermus scotoductus]